MKTKQLYTVILDYAGGTYISQVRSASLYQVLAKWLEQIPQADFKSWKTSRKELGQLLEEPLDPLTGVSGVWCATASGKKGLMLANVVATYESTT
jgi:hypothetical protein